MEFNRIGRMPRYFLNCSAILLKNNVRFDKELTTKDTTPFEVLMLPIGTLSL